MPSGWWSTELLLLLLLLLPAAAQAQSGDADTEPRISCTSDIMTVRSSLTCRVSGGGGVEDDEDEEDSVERMTVCYTHWTERRMCVEAPGDTISFEDLTALLDCNVTVHLKRGRSITTTVSMKTIVKPRSPQVWNVTFKPELNQAVVRIRTPYHNEYLKVDNQLFQLLIRSAGSSTIQNISSSDSLIIDMEHLQENTEYAVRARAIPLKYLQGSWSEWSDTFTFFTPAAAGPQTDTRTETETAGHTRSEMIVCLVPLLLVTSAVLFFWKHKIFSYMWPSIPQPKHALVQICKPNKGLLLNFKPEVFNVLKVSPKEKAEEPSEDTAAADGTQWNHPCSTQSSDCSRSTTSISTEELELSALLSRSSSEGEDSLQSTSPSPINALQLGEKLDTPERSGGGNEAEAYVTMSSFYQIK